MWQCPEPSWRLLLPYRTLGGCHLPPHCVPGSQLLMLHKVGCLSAARVPAFFCDGGWLALEGQEAKQTLETGTQDAGWPGTPATPAPH